MTETRLSSPVSVLIFIFLLEIPKLQDFTKCFRISHCIIQCVVGVLSLLKPLPICVSEVIHHAPIDIPDATRTVSKWVFPDAQKVREIIVHKRPVETIIVRKKYWTTLGC